MSCFRTHWGGLRGKGSAEKPTRSGGSAAKPDEYAVFVFYNIGWQSSLFYELANHAEALHQDLWEALEMKSADVVMLSECGERWLTLVPKVCGPGFCVVHQGHYTSIARVHTVEVLEGPSLKGPPSRFHADRTCQHLRVQVKDSAAEPIDLDKLERNDARLRLRQGKRDADGHRDTPLGKKYKSGELAKTCAAAEAEYRPRKTLGAAHSMGNRVHW